jgi:hypothetical protein
MQKSGRLSTKRVVMTSGGKLREMDPMEPKRGITGERGGWPFRTSLASTSQFKSQYGKLTKDHSTGIFSDSIKFEPPSSFDGRKVWAKNMRPVRNQGWCGACWAFASAFVLQTRLSISTAGKYNLDLSPGAMVLCNMGSEHEFVLAKAQVDKGEPYDFNLPSESVDVRRKEVEAVSAVGCGGETLLGAWQYIYRFGIPEESCVTYEDNVDDEVDLGHFYDGQKLKTCADLFGDKYDVCPANNDHRQSNLAVGYYHVPGAPATQTNMESGTEADIRREIYHWGPVTTGFSVHADFMAWDGQGIYRWDGKSEDQGGHAVVIVGWGAEGGIMYWIIRNSWGEYWGDGGHFRMVRGVNDCGIEENVIVGLPNMYGYRLYLEWPLLHRTEDLMLRTLWGVRSSGYKTTTIEDMVIGKIPGDRKDIYNQQYDPMWWPDVSTMLAGDPRTIRFRLADSTRLLKHPSRFLNSHGEFVAGLAAGGVLFCLAGIGILVVHMHKNKKKIL